MTATVMALALCISLITDLRSRKIWNAVTLPAMGFGLAANTASDGVSGFAFAGLGLLAGFALLLIPYLLGGMGAGDVKLLAAIGALQGPAFVFYAFLYTAVAGGVIAAAIVTARRDWKRIAYSLGVLHGSVGSLQVLDKTEMHHAFPYAVPIAIGAVAAFWRGGML